MKLFDPPCRNTEICPPWKSCLECEWRVCVSSTDALVVFVCLFVRSTISRQPAGRFTPKFACGRTLVPDVSSPILGVGGSRRAEKEANEIFVSMGVNGEFFCILAVFLAISQQRVHGSTPNIICVGTMSDALVLFLNLRPLHNYITTR